MREREVEWVRSGVFVFYIILLLFLLLLLYKMCRLKLLVEFSAFFFIFSSCLPASIDQIASTTYHIEMGRIEECLSLTQLTVENCENVLKCDLSSETHCAYYKKQKASKPSIFWVDLRVWGETKLFQKFTSTSHSQI